MSASWRDMMGPLVLLPSLGTQLGNGCVSDDGGGGEGTSGYRTPPDQIDERRPVRMRRTSPSGESERLVRSSSS